MRFLSTGLNPPAENKVRTWRGRVIWEERIQRGDCQQLPFLLSSIAGRATSAGISCTGSPPGWRKPGRFLVVEDLNARGLARNGNLSRSVRDVGWETFRRMPEYKCAGYGARLIVAPRGFPSTKRCSRCGWVGPALPLSRRVFRCEACGLEMDRDLHAALHLRDYGWAARKGPTGSSPGSHAGRGVPSRSKTGRGAPDPSGGGTARSRSTSHGSLKQEAAGRLFRPSG